MKAPLLAAAAAATAACIAAPVAVAGEASPTLAEVQARETLRCGVNPGLAGFAFEDVNGVWQGFDVAYCRSIAAAVLGDPQAVSFVPVSVQTRFVALETGEVDVLMRDTPWTFTGDVDFAVNFVAISYFDTLGFLIGREHGAASVLDLERPHVCYLAGSSAEAGVAEFFRAAGAEFEGVPLASGGEAQLHYLSGGCDVYAAGVATLAATRASFAEPEQHVVLSETGAKEPLGIAVRDSDGHWADIVRWVHFALVAAEELGITTANIAELAQGSEKPEVARLLGIKGDYGAMLGLDDEWAIRAISAAGNYGEIFAGTIGEGTPIGLPRGLNALWTQGGLHYAPPFR